MLTIIIPALNEEATIADIVRSCISQPLVTEVLVVDDNSEDETVSRAIGAGARVIHSEVRGKGISMREGIISSKNDIIVFLDGDIFPYPEGTIKNLTEPILSDKADFVKGAFARNAGRVTELVAKPLLNIFYPGLSKFSQPLSGMIAGKKQFFSKIKLFNDYGVDVGILIDMYLMQARITEVNIGYIENKSKPWEALGKMSKEVSRAIISKAQDQHPDGISEEAINSLETINREMSRTLRENLSQYHKMLILDMDDTILEGRFIDECAKTFGFLPALEDLRSSEKDPIILTKRIGLLLRGNSMDDLLQVAGRIPIVKDLKDVIKELKSKGYVVGIISNSYTLVTNYIKKNIEADFCYANQLEFYEGKATGEVNLPSYFFGSPESICGHPYCKTNVLQYACDKYHVLLKNCIVVGDSRDDRCMVAHAGKGVSFCTKDELLETVAFKNITESSFEPLLCLA